MGIGIWYSGIVIRLSGIRKGKSRVEQYLHEGQGLLQTHSDSFPFTNHYSSHTPDSLPDLPPHP
jgi:hypothetical protein